MKIIFLDAATLGEDLTVEIPKMFGSLGEVTLRAATALGEVESVVSDCDIAVVNKVRLNEANLKNANKLRLICVAATGYDNIDTKYCAERGIAVCNVVGYSSHSVAQVTAAMALSLVCRLPEYTEFVTSGAYTESGVANRLTPVYGELCGKTWGVVGAGNIGGMVARIAEALGCRVIVNKRTPDDSFTCVDIDTLCRESDIISVHTPLTPETRGLISRERIAMMKKTAVFINVARGAVTDEEALADAICEGRLGGLGVDVYTAEPLPEGHPFRRLLGNSRVCLTPHMAWGAYEARVRCLNIIKNNIEVFLSGSRQNRVD